MKANHAEVFIAACMSLALGNTDRLAALREEATRSSIRILPPDINHSGADFTVERTDDGGLAIRYALAAVKKVGFAAMQSLVDARGDTAFADLADFAARVDPRQLNRMQLENLIRAGAFDTLEPNRARLFAAAEAILRRAQATAEEKESGQTALFGASRPVARARPCICRRCATGRRWSGSTSRRRRSASTSLRIRWTSTPRRCVVLAPRRARKWKPSRMAGVTRVRLAGMVVAQKERVTRTGNRMAWVRITDASGSCEVTLFAEVLSRSRESADLWVERAGHCRSAAGRRGSAGHRTGCRLAR